MKTFNVSSYKVIEHGLEHEQYFQGCGVSNTDYTHSYTGCGSSPRWALEDALEQAVCAGCVFSPEDTESITALLAQVAQVTPSELEYAQCTEEGGYADGLHYYTSILVK